MSFGFVATLGKMGVWLAVLLGTAPIMLWVERRGSALMQDRRGPNRVGPLGLFQGLADAIKFLFKEDIIPAGADRTFYLMAPMLALVPALTTFVVIPFGPVVQVGDHAVNLLVADIDTGVLLLLALASLGVYSLVMAGYSSNNKYSLMGAVRASAQMISYELALTLSVVGGAHPGGILPPRRGGRGAAGHGWLRGSGTSLPQFVGFFVFLVASFAETNRLPFDLPEAESELVAGYHTEYSSMKFALFFMGEYMSMATLSALAATLYFGGWHFPGIDYTGPWLWVAIKGLTVLMAKIAVFMLFFVWVRWTLPALPLRPAHATRLEGAAAAGDRQPGGRSRH